MTVKPCNRLAVGGPQIRIDGIYRRFSFMLTRIMLGLISPCSAKQTLGEVETKILI